MWRMRQVALLRDFDPKRGISIASLAYDYPAGFPIPEHAHGSDQLIYAVRGLMEVHSAQSVWFIPPTFALWVPAGTLHSIRMPVAVSMRTLYLRPGVARRKDAECAVLSISPFLRALILEIVQIGELRTTISEHCSLHDLTALHVARATSIPTQIQMPRDPRALGVTTKLLDRLAEAPSLQTICKEVGVSTRTLQRLFRDELGVDPDSWRQQVRLTRAIEHLVAGKPVKQVASTVGYGQPSAFVAAFRRVYGKTPKVWLDAIIRTGPH